MVVKAGCPETPVLEQLALGLMSPENVEGLAEHCEGCERCVEVLQRLRAEDFLVEAMRSQSTATKHALPTNVQEIMQGMKRLSPAGDTPSTAETAAPSQANRPADKDTPSGPASSELASECYDFLAPAQSPDELGRLGPYRVLKVLGEGGMGVVFLAEDPELRRRVALKAMKPALAVSSAARQRFLREARAMAAVQHDHIVHINQIDQAGGIPFLAMPYLEGETLEDRLQREGRLPPADVIQVGREIAEGLSAAHERGLIHRDIKPANVWLEGKRCRVKILDFGLARTVDDQTRLTQVGAIAGTPAYMAPEQAQGGPVDFHCDLFSLGCLLYRAATGETPFTGRTTLEILHSLEMHHPSPPRELNPAVPPRLSELILHLLAKNPADRPASAGAVVEALQAIDLEPPPPLLLTVPSEPADIGPSHREVTSLSGAKGDSRPARRFPLVAAVLVLALLPLSYFFGGTVIRFITNKGELVIETDDPNIEVTIKGDSAVVHDRVKDRRFVLTAGEYEVEVREQGDGGVRFATRRFAITRGGRETFNASLELARAEPTKLGPADGTGSPDGGAKGAGVERALALIKELGGSVEFDPNEPGPIKPVVKVDLANTKLTDAGLAQLGALKAVQVLELGGCHGITDAGLEHLEAFPNLRHVDFTFVDISDAGLAHVGKLRRLEHLGGLWSDRVTDEGLRHLGGLTELRQLGTINTRITGTGFRHMKACTGLSYLSLENAPLTDEGLEVLKVLTGLESLQIAGTQVTDAGLEHLRALPKLRVLAVGRTRLANAAVEHLKELKGLRELDVAVTEINEEGLKELQQALPGCEITPAPSPPADPDRAAATWFLGIGNALRIRADGQTYVVKKVSDLPDCPFRILTFYCDRDRKLTDQGMLDHLRGLTEVEGFDTGAPIDGTGFACFKGNTKPIGFAIDNVPLTDEGLKAIGQIPKLESIFTNSYLVTDAGLAHLAGHSEMARLSILCFHVTDAGFAHLKGLTNVGNLNLYTTSIGDASLALLVNWNRLDLLILRNTRVTDEGMKHVARIPNLRDLNISDTSVGDKGLEHLIEAPNLQILRIQNTYVTDAGVKKFKAAKPNCQVER